jgi:hypothetical protein
LQRELPVEKTKRKNKTIQNYKQITNLKKQLNINQFKNKDNNIKYKKNSHTLNANFCIIF